MNDDVPTLRSPDAMDEITQREDGAATPLMAPIAVSARETSTATSREVVFEMRDLSVYYGDTLALRGVNMQIYKNVITAMIGPSGCGKSTFVRSLNRMNDSISGFHVTGQALYHGHDIYGSGVDPVEVRRRIGMVFQRPNPFPKSIFDNIAWAPRILGMRSNLNERIEKALRGAALWDEVKDRLKQSALGLSGGQQQRLCIARGLLHVVGHDHQRVLALERVHQLLDRGGRDRVQRRCGLVEYDDTEKLFTRPADQRTEDYVTGRFG